MHFYYNAGMNLCVDEDWLVWYLIENEDVEDEDEALGGFMAVESSMVGSSVRLPIPSQTSSKSN